MADRLIVGIGAVASFIAAALWFWSASVEIPDNIDTIVDQLQRSATLSGYGAIAAGVAALCALYEFGRRLL